MAGLTHYTFITNWWSVRGQLVPDSLTHVSGGGCWLVVGPFFPWRLQQPSLRGIRSIPKGWRQKFQGLWNLLQVTFTTICSFKQVTESAPMKRGGKIIPPLEERSNKGRIPNGMGGICGHETIYHTCHPSEQHFPFLLFRIPSMPVVSCWNPEWHNILFMTSYSTLPFFKGFFLLSIMFLSFICICYMEL